ncbi:MAG: hypothetical protein A3B96_00930 [Candidatus Spechtbacteria bacterium RIFCSPHIGHO2_02_FULL_43_15b]|uniref:Uncharacterized protein n=1 Tax=Candidatus Spechtbacteria bacterium RIFCSPHIGHO2_01_FULL_43_30 TaxID=1802158 RepID=A0A1G2H625_9BACT|nr:MAG: hypothetical protein A2827_01750 [Candidatus Spechtbacteria bacterium RIFCSPHIGHO2_01_FULL_43_30]OGZ60500.1 MAG: hypothetical protein A3B96_00930 [Candidatus Spechtbacteria bacterium RIFCSPHIGHO2_02_FULL_43_15b]
MILGFIDLKTFYLIFHLIGIACGVGGVYMSGFIFFSSIRDGKISEIEIKFIKLASLMVWIGVAILVCSGILLFSLDVERYMASTKFLAKITIVGIIILNGVFYHIRHIPKLVREEGKELNSRDSSILFASGAVSFVSWTSALILGAFRSVPYGYWEIMFFYAMVLAVSVISALILRSKLLRKKIEKQSVL